MLSLSLKRLSASGSIIVQARQSFPAHQRPACRTSCRKLPARLPGCGRQGGRFLPLQQGCRCDHRFERAAGNTRPPAQTRLKGGSGAGDGEDGVLVKIAGVQAGGVGPGVEVRQVFAGSSGAAELLAELGASELLAVEPPQPARMLQASAAQSSSERMRAYLNFIVVSSLSGAAAGPQHFKTIHPKYTFCRGGCQSDSAERISSGKYAPCTKKKRIFGNFAFLTFFAKIG